MISVASPKKFTIVALVLIGVVGFILFRLVWGSGVMLKTGDIEIRQGEAASEIWRTLVSDKYTDRTIPWKWYGRSGSAGKVQAGTYHVEKGEKIRTVFSRFVSGEAADSAFSVTFPEGFTVAQIGQRLEQRGLASAKDFEQEAHVGNFASQFSFLRDLSPSRSLEGYLFPDTYRVAKDDTAHDIIMRMLGNFDSKVPQSMRDAAKAQGRTLDQVVIMASIIEREAYRQEDMPVIADILWKRFDQELGLFVDATILYALQRTGELTAQDLAIDSPYNTRKYKDLPPTPISNPGLAAIQATITPQKTSYYYYLTKDDGSAVFAVTNDQHNVNKAKYLK